MISRLPKHGRIFVRLATVVERLFRRLDDRHLRTFVGARLIPGPSARVGGHRAYADWCFHAGVYAWLIAGLAQARARILDVGCGAGEIVPGVLQAMSNDSVYLGVDIDPRLIRQCQRTFVDPRVQFSVVAGTSPAYEVAGSVKGRDLSEICGERQWDVIIAKALFDHLSPKDVETHLQTFSRALRDDGWIVATFFVVDDEHRTSATRLNRRFRFDDVYPGYPGFRYSAAFSAVPEAQLAVEARHLGRLLALADLEVTRVLPGTWRDPEGKTGLDMPDTLLLRRRRPAGL